MRSRCYLWDGLVSCLESREGFRFGCKGREGVIPVGGFMARDVNHSNAGKFDSGRKDHLSRWESNLSLGSA